MEYRYLKAALVLSLLLSISPLFAQLGHYWTNQYGVRSTLLGNSVVGSVVDLGAVFYNPARLAVIEKPAFLLSADIYEWTNLRFENAFDEGENIRQSGFGDAPGFAAGTFNVKFLPKHRFAYAIMGRERTSIGVNYREEIMRDVFPDVDGDELFGAAININLDSKTRWYSLAWSYPISEGLGVGVTITGAESSVKRTGNLDLQALAQSGEVGIYRFERRFDAKQYGILWKIGLAGKVLDKLNWGMTITTPTIRFQGDGNYFYEEFLANLEDLPSDDRYTSDSQSDLDVRIKSPLSIALGLSIPISRLRIHLSSEWYNGIPEYTIMESTPHYSQSSGDTLGLILIDDLRGVVNFAIGLEYNASENLQLYASFNSDYSAAPEEVTSFVENEDIVSYTTLTSDLWHYSAGASFQIKTTELTLGFSQARFKQQFARPIDFPDEDGEVGITTDEPGTFRWSRLRLIFGFSVQFGKYEFNN